VKVKPGGKLLAEVDRNIIPHAGEIHPLMVTWDLPSGARVFACTGGLSFLAMKLSYGGVNYIPWEYYGDVTSNLMIYLDRRPVPQDIDLIHSVRSKGFEIRTKSSLLLNLLEFIEKFGANTRGIMREMDWINVEVAGAREEYIELRFEEVLHTYEGIGEVLGELEEEAILLKDRALLWVFIIEWLAVFGVSLVAGYALWSIMVRRRLYREIETTRLVEV
jgi:hypothetical protein